MGSSDTRTLRTPETLIRAGLVTPDNRDDVARVGQHYAIAVTPYLAERLRSESSDGPLSRQYLPDVAELNAGSDALSDPIGDQAHSPVPGVVHRYPDRVLLKVHHACAAYCRFCFRREMTGPGGAALDQTGLARALDYIGNTPRISEVILTGGDPLLMSTRRLTDLIHRLAGITHLQTLRVHTRLPMMAPERITQHLCQTLKSRLPVYVALHINHPDEFTPQTSEAIKTLADNDAVLLGQTVLLRGINDCPEVLDSLFRAMTRARIVPYYLHHPDKAPGTTHFQLSVARGRQIMQALRGRLPGYALPTYVLDIPGGSGKIPIEAPYIQPTGTEGKWRLTDPWGNQHTYCEDTQNA